MRTAWHCHAGYDGLMMDQSDAPEPTPVEYSRALRALIFGAVIPVLALALAFGIFRRPHHHDFMAVHSMIEMGNLTIHGPAEIRGPLSVEGNLRVNGPLTAYSVDKTQSDPQRQRSITLPDHTIVGPLKRRGPMDVRGNLQVNGPLEVRGVVSVAGDLQVNG